MESCFGTIKTELEMPNTKTGLIGWSSFGGPLQTDDNFASIINAIEESHWIFDNMQKFVHYLLAFNAGDVVWIFLAALLNWPIPLRAIQILWTNLVTDRLSALALTREPTEVDIRCPNSVLWSILT